MRYFTGITVWGIEILPGLHLDSLWGPDDVKNNAYMVSKNNQMGVLKLINGIPQVIIPFNYAIIQYNLAKQIFYCSTNTFIHYYNIDGKILSFDEVNKIERVEYSTVEEEFSNYSPEVIQVNEKYGVVLKNSSEEEESSYDTIIPVIYDGIMTKKYDQFYYAGEDIFGVKTNNKWGLLNYNKNMILPADYDSLNLELSDDFRHWLTYQRFFVVKQNNKWGIL